MTTRSRTVSPPPTSDPEALLQRLETRGANYARIKLICTFDLPHGLLGYGQELGSQDLRKLVQGLIQQRDLLLQSDKSLSTTKRAEILQSAAWIELLVVPALWRVNASQVGAWKPWIGRLWFRALTGKARSSRRCSFGHSIKRMAP